MGKYLQLFPDATVLDYANGKQLAFMTNMCGSHRLEPSSAAYQGALLISLNNHTAVALINN